MEFVLNISSSLSSAAYCLACILVAAMWTLWRRSVRTPYPPGPPADPLIGHLRFITFTDVPETFHRWAKTYGDLVYLHVLGRNILIIDSVEVAADLLDKRGSKYSDRPNAPIFQLQGWTPGLTLSRCPGKEFTIQRRMAQNYLGRREVTKFNSIQVREARRLVSELPVDAGKAYEQFRRFSASLIVEITYGQRITSDDDVWMKITHEVNRVAESSGPGGNTPIDFFPFLRHFPSWFPGTFYATKAREAYPIVRRFKDYPYETLKTQMVEGTAEPCFVKHELDAIDGDPDIDQETIIKGVAGALYGAGYDTTWATLGVFLYAMVLHPECQRTARNEIDAYLEGKRLPEFRDRKDLPYVEAVLQETIRWFPISPLGIPHRLSEDDHFNGFFIPKGTVVFANIRAMSLREEHYANPRKFLPERFLPPNGEPHFTQAFGFGRRVCVGRHFASDSLWIAIATILATLDLRKAVDSRGIEIIPEFKIHTGLAYHPHPFICDIQFRSRQLESLLYASL